MGSQDEHLLGGRFRIEREVGRGAVGVIYRAFDVQTQCNVALKVIAADVGVAPAEEARLKREGQVLTGLDHPGIVRIVAHGVSEHTGQPWVAMEWLDGEDLEARQRRSPLTLTEAIHLTQLVAEALACAHRHGVVHRDIKPGNIYLCGSLDAPPGEPCMPKLVDFGVARADQSQASFANVAKVTRVGDVVGTPAYMAPEQARTDGTIDSRSDIYALGALLFELVAGRPPHVGTSAIATLARLVTTPPPQLRDLKPEIPNALSELVSDMLETDADRRPQSADEVATALRAVLSDADRLSVAPASLDAPMSARLGSSASRLVTTIVAIGFTKNSLRQRALKHLSDRGAVAVPLGKDTLVAHLGARRASGTEASAALDLGRRLARAAAQVGVASGRAQVAQVKDGELRPVGEVVDRASSLAREASPGMVLADTTTAELGRGRYEFLSRDDGSAVVGEATRAGRERVGGAPFVGRDAELRQMLSAFERCRRDDRPAIVTVTGSPGIGKSRLRREFLARITSGAEIEVILQRSEAYGRAQALGAAAGLLRAVVGLSKGVSLEEADAAISAHLGDRQVDAAHRPALAALLANQPLPEGVDPRSVRDALWLSMTELVKLSVGASPTVIVADDMQWADPESIGWLEHMLGRLDGTALFVLALMRPSFWTEHDQTFAGKDHTRLELRPISARATLAIARAMLGEDVSDAVLERIATQSGGLPLFAEELARLTGAGGDASSAPTIEAAIQASLDSLDEETRDAIGRLSVLGLTVWDDALDALGISPAEPVMKELAAAEILVEQQTSRFGATREWVFKHALFRDVTYASLGTSQREQLHRLAGDWLAQAGEDAATVAGHFELADRADLAAAHWETAAWRALSTNALMDALNLAEKSLAFAEDKPSGFRRAQCLDEAWSRLDPRASDRESAIAALEENVFDDVSALRARGARARYAAERGGTYDTIDELTAIRDAAATLDIRDEEAQTGAVLATRLAFAGKFDEAEAVAERLLELSKQHGVEAAAVDGWQTLAIVRQTHGALNSALDARRSAAEAARLAGLKEREAMLRANLGFALTTIGARDEARASLDAGIELAQAIGSDGAIRHVKMNLLGWASSFGSDARLDAVLSDVRSKADAEASGYWTSQDRSNLGALFYRGWELLRGGSADRADAALALLKLASDGYRNSGNRDVLPVALGVYAEAQRRAGDLDAATALAKEAADLLTDVDSSLLNETTVYIALYRTCRDAGDAAGAASAIERGMPRLLRRLKGLARTPYARQFLTELADNSAFVAAADGLGLLPSSVSELLGTGVG